MSLQNVQAELAEILFSNDEQTDIIEPAANLIIYRNNMKANLTRTLHDTYPMIVKLVGEDFFRVAAKEYIRHYPSHSGNLHEYGEYFSHFIAEYPPLKNLIYLAEVAEFEWACHILHFAGDHPPLDLKALERISPDDYDRIHFVLHPASRIIKFHYPILRILDLCREITEGEININEGGVNLLIYRNHQGINFAALPHADYTFLTAVHENLPLSEALESALKMDPDFKLEERLPVWIADAIIVDFKCDE